MRSICNRFYLFDVPLPFFSHLLGEGNVCFSPRQSEPLALSLFTRHAFCLITRTFFYLLPSPLFLSIRESSLSFVSRSTLIEDRCLSCYLLLACTRGKRSRFLRKVGGRRGLSISIVLFYKGLTACSSFSPFECRSSPLPPQLRH